MVVFTFSVCYRKYHFWANLVLKIKIVSLSRNLEPRLILVCRVQWIYLIFLFSTWKFNPKNQNCQCKLKFCTSTNLNMQNSMVVFPFFVFDRKTTNTHFWANLVQIFKIVCSKWNFIPRLIRIWRIHWWCLFFVFDRKHPFLRKICSKKIKIVCWSWNLEPRLIQIRRIWWKFSYFFFSFLDW